MADVFGISNIATEYLHFIEYLSW